MKTLTILALFLTSISSFAQDGKPAATPAAVNKDGKSAPFLEKGGESDELKLAKEEVKHQLTMQKEVLDQKKANAESELNLGKITKQELIAQEIGFENEN